MTYESALEFINSISRSDKDLGLKKVRALLKLMGNPEKDLRIVHVAGTNGKGSTCTMLSHVLTGAGYKTGLYISPHIIEFRERVQLNNRMIPKGELAEITAEVKPYWEQLNAGGEPPSFFELVLVIALEYYRRNGCEIVILEVGIGGRLDATNIIPTPLVSVITSIGLDHVEMLGDTTEKIAREKAGIIKAGGNTVCYPALPAEALAVIKKTCEEKNNLLTIPNMPEIAKISLDGSQFLYDNKRYNISLLGRHQVVNASVVIEVCRLLNEKGFPLTYGDIYKGIAVTKFPARLEIVSTKPMIILDGAHNLSGAQTLSEALKLLKGRRIHGVVGVLSSKDADGVLKMVAPMLTSAVATQEGFMRGFIPPAEVAGKLKKYLGAVEYEDCPQKALEVAISKLEADDVVLVFGSLYLASSLRATILMQPNQP